MKLNALDTFQGLINAEHFIPSFFFFCWNALCVVYRISDRVKISGANLKWIEKFRDVCLVKQVSGWFWSTIRLLAIVTQLNVPYSDIYDL